MVWGGKARFRCSLFLIALAAFILLAPFALASDPFHISTGTSSTKNPAHTDPLAEFISNIGSNASSLPINQSLLPIAGAGAACIAAGAAYSRAKRKRSGGSGDISGEAWYSKLGRGWGYKAQETGKILGGIGTSIYKGVKHVVTHPVETLKAVGGFFANIGKGVADKLAWAASHPTEALYAATVGTSLKVAEVGANLVGSYINAWKTNPLDTAAKTAIVVGGALLIATGFGAPAGVAAIGIGLGLGGAAVVAGQESTEYITAKREDELKKLAKEDPDDFLWIASGVLTGVQGINSYKIASATKIDGVLKGIPRTAAVRRLPDGRIQLGLCENFDEAYSWHKNGKMIRESILAHEKAEAAILRGAVKKPTPESMRPLLTQYGMRYQTFDEALLPDVAASYLKGKGAMTLTREVVSKKNWAVYPELVSAAKSNVPAGWKLYQPGKAAVGASIAATGTYTAAKSPRSSNRASSFIKSINRGGRRVAKTIDRGVKKVTRKVSRSVSSFAKK
ncbi:MAG: hypothetical protein ACE5FW_01345, partial [Candidatus Aenigmatarchaeota archaeon]